MIIGEGALLSYCLCSRYRFKVVVRGNTLQKFL
jgi:hypothetical protein